MRLRKLYQLLVGKAEKASLEGALVAIGVPPASHVELLDEHEEALRVQLVRIELAQLVEDLVCLLLARTVVHSLAEVVGG